MSTNDMPQAPPPYTRNCKEMVPSCSKQYVVTRDQNCPPRDVSTLETLLPASDTTPRQSSNTKDFVPVVLPQMSKSFRGAFFSPFVRAYTSELANHGIDQETFLSFIDGLNERFVAHPVFQILGIAGGVMSTIYGVHPVQFAGIGLQVASGGASAATSYARTKAYVKEMNAELWHPAGLSCKILTTKKMMPQVGCPEEKIQLPPLNTWNDLNQQDSKDDHANLMMAELKPDDPRMRRIRALEGYIAPLDFDVPNAVAPETLLRRMGDSQARRLARKQCKKQSKDREDYFKAAAEAEAVLKYGDKDLVKYEKKMAKLDLKAGSEDNVHKREKLLRKHSETHSKLMKKAGKEKGKKEYQEDVRKYQKEADKELAKLDKKEQKVAQKIRWIVISRWDPDEEDNDSARGRF